MHYARIARRNWIEPHRLMLAFGALADRQRHPMQLLAPARSIRFSLERNRRRVLDSARQDPIHHVLERVESLPMPPDQNSRTVALDFELDRFRIDLDLTHLGLLAHLLEDLFQDNIRLATLFLLVPALAIRARPIVGSCARP